MFLDNIGTGAWVVGTPITLAATPTVTNNNVSLNNTNNGVNITVPGWYKARLQAVVVADGTTVGAQFVANGNAIPETNVTITSISASAMELVIEYPFEVTSANTPNVALLQFVPTTTATSASGYVTIEKIS